MIWSSKIPPKNRKHVPDQRIYLRIIYSNVWVVFYARAQKNHPMYVRKNLTRTSIFRGSHICHTAPHTYWWWWSNATKTTGSIVVVCHRACIKCLQKIQIYECAWFYPYIYKELTYIIDNISQIHSHAQRLFHFIL